MKQLLIDTAHEEETIALVVENEQILEMHQEMGGLKKGNIYTATIANIDYALQTVFVHFGGMRPGFLPIDNIDEQYFEQTGHTNKKHIQNINPSTVFLVQIEKEERFNKGAYLTTHICLLGRYCVLMPNPKTSVNGISKKIQDKQERTRLQEIAAKLQIPQVYGLIWRTAVENAKYVDIKRDYRALCKLWHDINQKAAKNMNIASGKNKSRPCLIYEEARGVLKILRDNCIGVSKIGVLNETDYKTASRFLALFLGAKHNIEIKIMQEELNYFSGHAFNNYLNQLSARRIALPSGGSIQITHTEALISIDVNSGKAKQSAFDVNMEAVQECVKQILLKNLHGIIVIDMIDMDNQEQYKAIESVIKERLKFDKARLKIAKINELGLLELSRQRINPSVFDWLLTSCKHCHCTGSALNINFIGRLITRAVYHKLLNALGNKERACILTVTDAIARWIISEKTEFLQLLKQYFRTKLKIVINNNFQNQEFKVEIIR